LTKPRCSAPHLISQGRALVRAIEALGTIEPTGPLERLLMRLLLAAYKRLLRSIVGAAPAWASEEILSTTGFKQWQR